MAKKKDADEVELSEIQKAHEQAMKPSLQVLTALGSLAVHIDEFFSPSGHHYDQLAIQSILSSQPLREWIGLMDNAGLLPKKRG